MPNWKKIEKKVEKRHERQKRMKRKEDKRDRKYGKVSIDAINYHITALHRWRSFVVTVICASLFVLLIGAIVMLLSVMLNNATDFMLSLGFAVGAAAIALLLCPIWILLGRSIDKWEVVVANRFRGNFFDDQKGEQNV